MILKGGRSKGGKGWKRSYKRVGEGERMEKIGATEFRGGKRSQGVKSWGRGGKQSSWVKGGKRYYKGGGGKGEGL